MKIIKFIIITFLLFSSIKVFSQSFNSIFSENITRWNVYEAEIDAGGTIAYFTNSDTLINEKKYFKIYSERLYSPDQVIGEYSELFGFVYEDTLVGKYWFRKFFEGEFKEELFMDLSLDIGDTMCIISDFRYMWTDSVIVEDVSYENNLKIITLDYNIQHLWGTEKLKFIEGIGASNGFYMAEYLETPNIYQLICKFNDDEQIYTFNSEQYPDCYQDGGAYISENVNDKLLFVYPNPSSNQVTVKLLKTGLIDLQYIVFDLMGNRLKHGVTNKTEINLEFENAGIYFIKIFNNKYSYTEKIIIK